MTPTITRPTGWTSTRSIRWTSASRASSVPVGTIGYHQVQSCTIGTIIQKPHTEIPSHTQYPCPITNPTYSSGAFLPLYMVNRKSFKDCDRYNQVQSGTIRYQWVPVGTSVPGTRCTKKTMTKSTVLPTSLMSFLNGLCTRYWAASLHSAAVVISVPRRVAKCHRYGICVKFLTVWGKTSWFGWSLWTARFIGVILPQTSVHLAKILSRILFHWSNFNPDTCTV